MDVASELVKIEEILDKISGLDRTKLDLSQRIRVSEVSASLTVLHNELSGVSLDGS